MVKFVKTQTKHKVVGKGLGAFFLVLLVGGCSTLTENLSILNSKKEEKTQERVYKTSDIVWINPSQLRIAFNLPKSVDMKNQKTSLELGLGPRGSTQLSARERFVLIRVPKRELKDVKLPTDSQPNRELAIFRFNTDDHARVQGLVNQKIVSIRAAEQAGRSVDAEIVDVFNMYPSFCRKSAAKDQELISATVLYSSLRDPQDNQPYVRDFIRDRPLKDLLGSKAIKRC